MGLSFKDVGKGLSSIGRHAGHAATSFVKGDWDKTLTYAGKTVNDVWNTIPLGQMVNSGMDKLAGGNGETPDTTTPETTPEQKITDAKADSVKRRRALYATKGGSLGEEVEKVGSTFGNGRGTLFGN